MDVSLPPTSGLRMQDIGDRIVVHFPPRRAWREVLPAGLFFVLWTSAGVVALVDVLVKHEWGTLVWLAFWSMFEAVLAYAIADALFGHETLIVTPERLEVRHDIGRFSKTRVLDAAAVGDVKASVTVGEDDEPRSEYGLQVAYGDENVRIGDGLTRGEAEEIASAVESRIHPRSWWDEEDHASQPRRKPEAQPAAGRRSRWRKIGAILFLFFVVVISGVWATAFRDKKHDKHPRAVPSAGSPEQSQWPQREQFRSAREYATAVTSYMLSSNGSQIVGDVSCGPRVTWTDWTCGARIKTTWQGRVGQTLPYTCSPAPGAGFGCHLVTPPQLVTPPPTNPDG